ncbi:hypothetical protein CRV24_005049 [Beauveria bassiana]|nr:hypothetical protein CRV24_005049 [Beauveria bassiana]KAH8711692.1 hypothetical protein HC256_008505 [Beauveria bassiana]
MVVPKYRKWLEEASKIGGMNTHCERSSTEPSGTSSDGVKRLELFSDSFFAFHDSLSYQLAVQIYCVLWDMRMNDYEFTNTFTNTTYVDGTHRAWKLIPKEKKQLDGQDEQQVTERKRGEKDDDEMSVRQLKSSASVDSGLDLTVQSTPETLHCDNATWTVFGLAYSHQLESRRPATLQENSTKMKDETGVKAGSLATFS